MTTLSRAALVVSGGILLSRLLGFLREAILAAFLGAGIETDLYRNAFTIPDYLFFLMAGGYLTITFVPILSRHLATGDTRGANESFTAVFRVVTGLMVAVTLLALLLSDPLTRLAFPQTPPERLPELVGLVRIALPAQVFFVLGSLTMAYQYAQRRFVIPSLAPLIYNVAIIGGGLVTVVLNGEATPGGFVWGSLVGAVVGNFALQWWGARRLGARLVAGIGWRHPAILAYFALALPLMIGQSAVALDEVFYKLFGQLGGDGAVASLGYARSLNMVPVGVVAQAAGVASFPFLARLFAEGKLTDMAATLQRALRSGLVVAGLAAAGAVGLALPAVQVAFQRGEFDAAASLNVASLLTIYGLSIPLWTAHQIYTRGFYARQRMWLPVAVGSAATVVAVPLYWWGATRFGAEGVAAASVAIMAIYTVTVGWWWHRSIEMQPIGGTLARVGAAALGATAAGWVVVRLATGGSPVDPVTALAVLIGGGVATVAVYVGVLALLGAPELTEVRAWGRRSSRAG